MILFTDYLIKIIQSYDKIHFFHRSSSIFLLFNFMKVFSDTPPPSRQKMWDFAEYHTTEWTEQQTQLFSFLVIPFHTDRLGRATCSQEKVIVTSTLQFWKNFQLLKILFLIYYVLCEHRVICLIWEKTHKNPQQIKKKNYLPTFTFHSKEIH